MTVKTSFISFRCSDDLKAALDAHLGQSKQNRTAFIVDALWAALKLPQQGTSAQAMDAERDDVAAHIGQLERAFAEFADDLRRRVCALEDQQLSLPAVNLPTQSTPELSDTRHATPLGTKADEDVGWLSIGEAYSALGGDRSNPELMPLHPATGQPISYERFRSNRHHAYFQKLGFECSAARRNERRPWLRWARAMPVPTG